MAQGKKPFFTFNDLKQAAIKGGFDKAQDFGKQIYDIGADALGGVFDIADRNRIDRLKNDKTQQKEVQKLQANIQKRKAEDVQRNKDLAEINLENQGKSTRLESKDRIVKKLASNEVKAVKQVKNDLTKNVDQAINERVAVLRAAGEPEDKIQSWVAMQKSGAGNQIKNITSMESQASSKAVNDLARGGGVNPFAIDRANQEFEQLQGKEVDTKRAIRTSVPVETLARTIKPIVDMGNDIELLATTGIDKVLGTNLTKASLANIEAQKAKGAQIGGMNYADALDVDQSLGAQAQRFVGQSVPFMLAPETAVARRAGVAAARMLRPGLLRNVVKAGITEGIQDTPLSTLQTVAELNRRVQTGEITGQEAMQQLPSAIGGNLIGDIGGAGLLRGAGDLANKALKGAPDLVNPTRNQKGSMALEAPPKTEAPKVLTPEDIKKAQYQKSFNRLNELAPKQKELTQAITKAQIEGDYARVALLKQEARAVKEEAKYLKQTVNNLELEGLKKAQEAPQASPEAAPQVNQDVENIRKIFGNNQEGILPQQQPKLGQETKTTISGGQAPEPFLQSQNKISFETPSSRVRSERALIPEQRQELKAFNNVNQGIDNLAQKAQSTEPPKSLEKQAAKDLKNQYNDLLSKDSNIGEKPVRDGLEELGFEIKTNKQGAKYAQLGNTKISLKDMPPPYSVSGLKASIKERIASQRAVKDVQQGKPHLDELDSGFLNDSEADKFLSKFEGKALDEETQFVDSIKNAKSIDELNNLVRDKEDLFGYDAQGNPNKYLKEFEAREAQLNDLAENKTLEPQGLKVSENPTIRDSRTVQTPKNQAELEQVYKTTFKLDEPKAKAAAVVTDRIFDTIARRKGITKEAAYSEVSFKKSNLNEVQGKSGIKYQTAYHGTPHEFDQFLKEKIGTGEGQQLFGHGLYLTDVEDVAKFYAGSTPKAEYSPFYKKFEELGESETFKNAIQRDVLPILYAKERGAQDPQRLAQAKERFNELKEKTDKLKQQIEEEEKTDWKSLWEEKERLWKKKELTREESIRLSALKDLLDYRAKPEEIAVKKELVKFYESATKDGLENMKIHDRHLLKTEIDPTKTNFIKWEEPLNEPDLKKIINEFNKTKASSPEQIAKIKEMTGKDWKYYVKQKLSAKTLKDKTAGEVYDIIADRLKGHKKNGQAEASQFLNLLGFDGVKYSTGSLSNLESFKQGSNFVVFDPATIKITDRYKFQGERGAMETLESGKKVIHALTDPNVSTPLHEIAHVYEEVLTKSERNTILDWAGSKEWDTNASEKFARGFERYLAEGKAPIPALKEIFEDFKDWLVDIYKSITGSEIDLKLNKQMRKIYDDMIALDPKLSESLSAKTLNKEQGLKGVRRVIYEPKAFQEAQRNPKNLSTLTEAYGDKVPKNSEKIMSEASKVKKELNDVEASLKDNKAQLAKIMRDAKVDSIEVEIDGKKYTIKRPTKPDDKVVFNNQGRLAREELVNQFQKEGKISFDGDQGINLAIQSEAKAASRATKYGTKNLEEAAKEHVKFLREAAVLGEKEAVLKEKIMKDIVPSLENGGLDHVWRNNEGDTSFAIKRNPTKSNFKTPEAEAEFKAREAELKANIDNVKIQKGEYGSTGLSEAQAMGLNRRTKAGKAEYQEFQSKIRRDIEAKTALEDGIETSKQAESVIESGLEQYKKLDDGLKGKQFAFNPAMAAALLDSDAALLGLKAFKPLIDKALNKQGALVSNVYDGLKTVVGRSESYATRLRDSKIPAFRKLIEDYDNLAAREYQAEGYMRTKFSPEQVEKIGAAIKEHGFRELEDMMKGGKAIEGIESIDEMEILKAFMQNRRKRADLIKDSIEQGKKANIAKGDLHLLESFYANETKVNKGTGAALQSLATDLLYFKALWNNLKSTTLVATDPLTKLVPEFGIGKTALSLKDVMDSKVRNSPLFKAYNAGASGTFVDALTARKAEGLGKVWEKIKKTSIFSAVTEASQDMGLLAHARSFNDYWKKKTGESINILDDFDGMNEASQEFALMHNALTNKLYGAGKGTIYQAEIEGNNFIKPFMAFMGEPIRFQKRMSEWRSIMAKANEPGATTLDKEMAKRARNGMITFVAMTALLGGSTALKNMGGAIGSSYNLALNLMTPEERQRTEDWINAFQLTRYLNIDLGEKLGVSLLQRGEKESFLDSIKKSLSGDSGIAVVQALVQYPKDFEKMQNYFKAGNKEQAYFTMAKMLMGSAPGTVDKILKKLNQEPISVWIEENGNMKEEFKAVDLADILSYSANETDIKKAVKMETKAKEAAVGKVEKIGKRYKLASNSKEFNEYLDLLSSERFKLNPVANRQELEQKLLKAAFAKQTNQSKQLAKFAPKTSVAYLKSQSEEDLIKRIAASSGEKRQEAVQALHQLKAQSKKQERRKFVNVLAELEESA